MNKREIRNKAAFDTWLNGPTYERGQLDFEGRTYFVRSTFMDDRLVHWRISDVAPKDDDGGVPRQSFDCSEDDQVVGSFDSDHYIDIFSQDTGIDLSSFHRVNLFGKGYFFREKPETIKLSDFNRDRYTKNRLVAEWFVAQLEAGPAFLVRGDETLVFDYDRAVEIAMRDGGTITEIGERV